MIQPSLIPPDEPSPTEHLDRPAAHLDQPSAALIAHNPPPLLHGILFGPVGLRAGWGLLLFLLLFIGSSILVSHLHLLPPRPHTAPGQTAPEMPPGSAIFGESVSLGLVLLSTWIMSRIERRPFGVYGLVPQSQSRNPLRHFAQGLACGLTFLSLLVLLLWRSHLLIFTGLLLAPHQILRDAVIWALGFLLVALFEESFLRGYLQYTLARGLSSLFRHVEPAKAPTIGFWTAALLLSAVFGLSHGSNPGESPIGLFAAAFAGLVFTFSLWRTRSLWWAIGIHASWDWAQSFLYGVADSGTMIRNHLLASHPIGRPILSGGTTGPEGSLFVLPTLALVALVIALTLPHTKITTHPK